ncbi:hypothetical protein TH25_07360 [Thalassospira profundimaris]|uniref:Uncharacterized protein n=1 Tax=Thalassospira profundimaris TaxID=502049 RepID=A0A367XF84_9PROT|nr:hypothetical protein TH25_07360 [Thalassospira profundimaris]
MSIEIIPVIFLICTNLRNSVVAIRTKNGEFAAKYINAQVFELIPFSMAAHHFVRLTFGAMMQR